MRAGTVRQFLFFAIAISTLPALFSVTTSAQSATLFSPNKYPGEQRKSCVTLIKETPANYRPCDVSYGHLWAGGEMDWLESSAAAGNRSVIKDLGAYLWSAKFVVPVVAALPKLKPGEVRHVTVDTSGADGADGADGRPGANADGSLPENQTGSGARAEGESSNQTANTVNTRAPKNDGKPKIDPMFVKAVVGHIYVIHVVDDNNDFYALFRVDKLIRGDSCVISWKFIDAPAGDLR